METYPNYTIFLAPLICKHCGVVLTTLCFMYIFATIAAPYLDIKTLQTIMGHADIETTLDRYTHAQEERIRAAGELLTGKFKSSDS